MRVALSLLCVLAFLVGAITLLRAPTATHEIQGFVIFFICAALLESAAVLEARHPRRKKPQPLARPALIEPTGSSGSA
jgi:hypothetical protein